MPSSKSKAKPRTPSTPDFFHEWSFEAIGTSWWIGIAQPISTTRLQTLQQELHERIAQFDAVYSRFRSDSLVTRISQKAGTYIFPDDSKALFALYRKLYDRTAGHVTPLVGTLLAAAGYDATYSLQPRELSKPPAWDDVMSFRDQTLTTTEPILLDFGAAGKGYLVDLLSDMLIDQSITKFCIDASGDLRVHGLSKPLTIGLEHPADPSLAIGAVELQHSAICGSASNRRAWGAYHHIFNPETLEPVRNIQATWTIAANAALADGLATALFFTDPGELTKDFAFSYCVIYNDNTLTTSPSFPGQIFN